MSDALVFCSNCGQTVLSNASFCQHCGTTMPLVPTTPAGVAMPAASGQMYASHYAGFWIRVVALLIDSAVLQILFLPIFFILFGANFLAAARAGHNEPPDPSMFFGTVLLLMLISMAANWLYEAFLTSSTWQGTLGKKALGLKVTDLNGRRLTFAHATGRFFAKLVNSFTMGIGWIMAGFTQRKQGLHDMIASTLVIKS